MSDEESVFDARMVSNLIEVAVDPDIPDQLSPEWNDYVMKQFRESELIEINGNKYPTCYGLRRVVRLLIGEITFSGVKAVHHVNSNPPRTVVEYAVAVERNFSSVIEFSDLASVWQLNTDDLFLGYPDETAATRAEGRCLRKILMLNCVAAEELTRHKNVATEVRQNLQTGPTDGSYDSSGKITDSQLKLLTNKCSQMKIDPLKFVNVKQGFNEGGNVYTVCGSRQFNSVGEVSKKEAITMIKLLNNYQNNSQEIPKEVMV
jgi:hypothetical protein